MSQSEDFSHLKTELEVLKNNVDFLKASKDASSIAFHNIGIATSVEANNWIGENMPASNFAYLVDF